MKMNRLNMTGTSPLALAGVPMTAAEIAAGRYMRAPDHGAGDGGSGDGDGNGGGEWSAGGDAGAGGAGQGGQADGGATAQGAAPGESGDGGDNSAQAGQGDGDGDGGTILGDAAKGGDGDGSGKPEAKEGDGEGRGSGEGEGDEGGEGPRLTFGEGDDAQPILGAPEAYEVQAPEGMEFDKDAFAAVEPIFRDLNLSNEATQAVVNAYAEKILPMMADRAKTEGETLGADMRREWTQEATTQFDGKEGRPTLDEAKALSRQAFLKFGVGGNENDPFLQLLEDSGLGSHPVMLNTFANIGRAVGEGVIDPGKGGAQPTRLADRIYGQPIQPG